MQSLKSLLPGSLRVWLRDRRRQAEHGMLAFDRVTDWSVLRRTQPYREQLGRNRGACIDRFYVEKFLAANQACIRGSVAEFEGDDYVRQFGGDKVSHVDILDLNTGNTRRTITLDLAQPATVPQSVFDCIVCTQTMFLVRDYEAAIRSLHAMLKPGGTVLATVPGISPIIRGNLLAGAGEDWWRFTSRSAKDAFAQVFAEENVEVRSYGNVLAATAFLHGLVQEELSPDELEFNDPAYELIVGVKAVKARQE